MGKPSKSAIMKSKMHKAGFYPERKTIDGKRVWVLNNVKFDTLLEMISFLRKKKLISLD